MIGVQGLSFTVRFEIRWTVRMSAVESGLTHHLFRAYAPLFPAFLRVFHVN